MADKAAKEGLKLPLVTVSNVSASSSDFKSIAKLLISKWQQHWEDLPSNKLRERSSLTGLNILQNF